MSSFSFPSTRFHLTLLSFVVLCCFCPTRSSAQFYAASSDLVGLSTGTFNGEISYAVNTRWSLHVPVYYNPWTFSDNKKFKHISFLPGTRYWLDQSYGYGWFVGFHGIFSRFNVGGILGSKHRYEGNAYGAGISAGFSLPVHRFWNIEFEAGGGGAYIRRDKYNCVRCGDKVDKKSGAHLVPSKLSVNLIYLF